MKLRDQKDRRRGLATFQTIVILPTLALVAYLLWLDPSVVRPELILWIGVVAAVELLQVPFWRGVQVSVGFPVLLAVGMLFPPPAASLVALLGSFDLREFKREVTILRALFNRSQVALAVLAASSLFHKFATPEQDWLIVLPVAILAGLADYVINVALVSGAVTIAYGVRYLEALRSMRIGRSAEFFVNYIGLGFVGTVLAKLYVDPLIGIWAVPAVLMPLVLARQMFFRTRALEEAHQELQVREQVLRGLSDRMAEERQDERAQIAAYLHDDLAQLLFRLSLQVDVAKRHLKGGDIATAEADLEAIRDTKNRTSEMVRALIRDLHRSPLGRAGIAEALISFTGDVGDGTGVRFHPDIEEVSLPPAIQLLVYHIAREAVMNSLKHAAASNVWITLSPSGNGAELCVRDDGVGFDQAAPGPEGHYGLAMMRERAQVAGGTFKVESSPGNGTTITVDFPFAWSSQNGAPADASRDGDQFVPVAEPAPSRAPVGA